MKLHLLNRLYHLLWKVRRKQIAIFESEKVEYLSLPPWMLYNSQEAKARWGECTVITHASSKSVIILISKSEPSDVVRYTIYHEFIEGCCMLRIGIARNKETLAARFDKAFNELGLYGSEFEKAMNLYVKNTEDWEHAVALVFELLLVKRELGEEIFQSRLEHALEKRL